MSNVAYYTGLRLGMSPQKAASWFSDPVTANPWGQRTVGASAGALGGGIAGGALGALGGAAAGALSSDYDANGKKKKTTRGQRAMSGAGMGAMYGGGGGALAGGIAGGVYGPKAIQYLAAGSPVSNPRGMDLLKTLWFMAKNRGVTPNASYGRFHTETDEAPE